MSDKPERDLLKLSAKEMEAYADRLLLSQEAQARPFSYNTEEANDKKVSRPRYAKTHRDVPLYTTPKRTDSWAVCQGCGKARNSYSGKMCRRCYLLSLKIKREERISDHLNWQNRAEYYATLPMAGTQFESDGTISRVAITEAEEYV